MARKGNICIHTCQKSLLWMVCLQKCFQTASCVTQLHQNDTKPSHRCHSPIHCSKIYGFGRVSKKTKHPIHVRRLTAVFNYQLNWSWGPRNLRTHPKSQHKKHWKKPLERCPRWHDDHYDPDNFLEPGVWEEKFFFPRLLRLYTLLPLFTIP